MSTSYYRLRKPFTSVRATVSGGHTQVGIWINHANAGDITVRNDELASLLLAISSNTPSLTIIGLAAGETQARFEDDDLEPDTLLISECGNLFRLDDIVPEKAIS